MVKMIFLMILLLIYGCIPISCERLREQIYSPINGGAACFRRLNGTHQAGCSSSYNGAVGVVQMVMGLEDAKWLVTNATAGPYMAVVNTSLFNSVIELFMAQPDNIAGVLIYDAIDKADRAFSYSLESQCPNQYVDSDSQCSKPGGSLWNPRGSGLLRRDIPFPILFLSLEHNKEIDKIQACYERYNLDKDNQKGSPLCSVELNSFMYAAVSSELCLRRSASSNFFPSIKVCDPLGDYNVYYSLFPRVEGNNTKESVTLVTARIDSASLFDGVSPGAASSVVGMVTLLSTATILSKMISDADAANYDHNILFTLFNGEAFDYIGSQRVAYDLKRGQWPEHAPLSLASIKLHVEVGQIGGSLYDPSTMTPRDTWPMYAYTPNPLDLETDVFINQISNASNVILKSVFASVVPPSSVHSFRKILNQTAPPEIVITDHDEKGFTNMYYNSALDEYYQIGFVYRNISIGNNGTFLTTEELIASGVMNETDVQVKICRLATALANTLYKRVVGVEYNGNLSVSAHLVDELLYCYMQSQACPLMKAADYETSSPDNLSPSQPPLYVGVSHWASNPAVFTGHLLVLLAGSEVAADKTACKDLAKPGYGYYWLKGWNHTGVCMQTSMNMSHAISPAFIIEDYDWSSHEYSTWTESVWQGMSARVFVSAGGRGATAATVAGLCATVVAAVLTFWVKRHKNVMFVEAIASAAVDDATSGILRTVNC